MSQSAEIQKCEEQLKEAMLQSNISVLDTLLADDLIFINHLGQIMTKHDDIEAHKSKSYIINEITLSEQKIKIFENIAIVTVKTHIIGRYNGKESMNDFRFTRVWNKTSNNKWKITAGHSSMLS